jgi:hypothetical protein
LSVLARRTAFRNAASRMTCGGVREASRGIKRGCFDLTRECLHQSLDLADVAFERHRRVDRHGAMRTRRRKVNRTARAGDVLAR